VFQTTQDKRSLRSALLLGAASAAVVGLSVPATAQETTETVVVTGSRIPQTGLYSSSPVTAVGQQEMKFEGTTNVENLINNLPQAFADFGDTSSNGATGTATVNLRDLGSARTLVLIDGRRLMPGDVAFPVPDLNQIPAGLVDHIEVLTGGASAVYGSDAEAGVVNFIMRKDFEGVEFDGQYSVNNAGNDNSDFDKFNAATHFPSAPQGWWGGETDDATIIVGANSPNGKGNVTAYLGFRNTDAVLESKRNFSACSISVTRTDTHACAGSSNYNRWISIDDYFGGTTYDLFQHGTGAPGSGTFVPYAGAPDQKFNYGPLNYLQRPDTRYTGGFFGHYEVAPALDIYSQFMFTDDHSVAQIAQGGAFLGTYFNINCDNPLMTAQERHALCSSNPQAGLGINPDCVVVDSTGNCNLTPGFANITVGRRDLEGGFRTTDLRHTAYRAVIGAKGDLGSGWSYDLYALYGTTLTENFQGGNWSTQRTINALNVDPATGQCFVAETGVDNSCVPLDIFNGFGSISPAALNYINANGFITGYTEEQVVSGSLSGDLGQYGIKSPWAKDAVGIALGGEYRAEYIQQTSAANFRSAICSATVARRYPCRARASTWKKGSEKSAFRWSRACHGSKTCRSTAAIATPPTTSPVASVPISTARSGSRSTISAFASAISVPFARRTCWNCLHRTTSSCSAVRTRARPRPMRPSSTIAKAQAASVMRRCRMWAPEFLPARRRSVTSRLAATPTWFRKGRTPARLVSS